MPKTVVNHLTLQDVEDRIQEFERRFEITTAEFLRDPDAKVSEAVALKWNALIDFRRELREAHAEMHHRYLANLNSKSKEKDSAQQVELAA